MSASILLVDDEQNILKTVCIALESSGYRVTSYLNPLQAVEQCVTRPLTSASSI